MASIMEIMQLCRLCLVKEQVNIPIFEQQGDIRDVFLKIRACLPVKVTKEDKLPKKICDGCSYKLDLLYQFSNTCSNAEKQLLTWLNQMNSETMKEDADVPNQTLASQPQHVKQEMLEVADNGNDTADSEYLLQQQLPFEGSDLPATESHDENGGGDDGGVDDDSSDDEPLAKRRKRLIKSHTDTDPSSGLHSVAHMAVTKTEDASDSDGDDNADDPEPSFVSVGTDDDQQPGPSGLGKASADIPLKGPDEKDKTVAQNKDKYDLANVHVLLTDLKYMNTNALSKLYDITINLEVPKNSFKVVDVGDDNGIENIVHDNVQNNTKEKVFAMPSHTPDSGGATSVNEVSCLECNKVFMNRHQYRLHQKMHNLRKSRRNSANVMRPKQKVVQNYEQKPVRIWNSDEFTPIIKETCNSANLGTQGNSNSIIDSPCNKQIVENSDTDVEHVEFVLNDIEFENNVTNEREIQPIMDDQKNIAKVGSGLPKCTKEFRIQTTSQNEVIEVIDSDDEAATKESLTTNSNSSLEPGESQVSVTRILVLNKKSNKLVPLLVPINNMSPLVPRKYLLVPDTCRKCNTVSGELNQKKICDKCANNVDDGSDENLVIDLGEDSSNDTSAVINPTNSAQQLLPTNTSESNGEDVILGDISIAVTCVSCKLKMKPDHVQFIGGQIKCNECVGKKLTCFYCKVQFASPDALKLHTQEMHFCKICSKHYADMVKHKLKQVPCIICHVLICKKYGIPRHYQARHNKFWCSNCNSVFDGEYDLYVHVREKHKV